MKPSQQSNSLQLRLHSPCSRHFTFSDLIHCGDTQASFQLENLPQQEDSWLALEQLAKHVLDPVADQFGKLTLTYGFCGHQLGNKIKKNPHPRIAPALDQHASFELNSKGDQICCRGGAACDFMVDKHKTEMHTVAHWICQHLPTIHSVSGVSSVSCTNGERPTSVPGTSGIASE